MKKLFCLLCFVLPGQLFADTMDHFMNIVNNIPKMEIKADPQSQAWAHSARNVLQITSESIAETIITANKEATSAGHPIFCVPASKQLDGETLNHLIQQKFKEIASTNDAAGQLTVSDVAWQAVKQKFPCRQNAARNAVSTMMHVDGQG